METNSIKSSGTPLSFPDAKIIVYATPKAACSSIKQTLAQSYVERVADSEKALKLLRRQSLHDLKRNVRDSDFLRIGFCRNPYEKIRSIYAEKLIQKKYVKQTLLDLGFYKNMPFDEYIKLVAITTDEKAEKHLKSQYLLLFRDSPPALLIRFEELIRGWKVVQTVFKARGGKTILPLMKLNTTTVKKPVLTKYMKRLIAERYKKDFELLGYEA